MGLSLGHVGVDNYGSTRGWPMQNFESRTAFHDDSKDMESWGVMTHEK